MNTKIDPTNENNTWGDCPSGELLGLAKRLQAAERRRKNLSLARVAAGTMATTAGLVLAIGLMLGGNGESVVASMKCDDCKANFVDYFAHLTVGKTFSQELAQQMTNHIKKCRWCRNAFERKYPGTLEEYNVLAADRILLPNGMSLDLSGATAGLGYAGAF